MQLTLKKFQNSVLALMLTVVLRNFDRYKLCHLATLVSYQEYYDNTISIWNWSQKTT